MRSHLRHLSASIPSALVLAAAAASLLAACGGDREPAGSGGAVAEGASDPGGDPGSDPAGASHGEPASAQGAAQGGDSLLFEVRERPEPSWKLDEVARRDPGVDGWETEVLHDRAKLALKHFLHAWVHPESSTAEELEPLLSSSFEGATALRPAELETLFDDGTTRALRPAALDPEAPLGAPDRLLGTLSDALEPFADRAGIDASFKFVKVDDRFPLFETTVLLELHGRTEEGPLQQNMTWRVGFEVGGGEDVLVLSIRLLEYEQVHTLRGFLAEHTGRVFGGHDFWDREFRLGVGDYYFRADKLTGNAFIGGQGLAVGDLNGDGLDDLYVCQQGGLPNRVFLHQPDGTTREVASELGLDLLDNTRGACIADLDNDGDQDLAIAVRQDVLLFYNPGDGTAFTPDVLRGRRAEDIFSVTAADPDLDGDLDLYACRYVKGGILGGVPTPYHDADNGAMNDFWRNRLAETGSRGFEEDTRGAGLMQNNTKFSLASVWEDFDLDGDVDLYVSNDFGRNNLYVNQHPRKFRDQAIERGADDMAAGMGATLADVDLDGWPDLLVTNMFSSAGLRIASVSSQFMDGENEEVHGHYLRHARGNTLLCNNGDGTFTDATELARVSMGRWGWGSLFVDFNNDGFEDLYTPNGFITNQDPEDM